MITIKSAPQIEKMRAAGALLHDVLSALRAAIQPGITTLELDRMAEKLIRDAGAIPSFKGYEGFPFSICASVDDQVVHGFATKDRRKEGQILSVDCGVIPVSYTHLDVYKRQTSRCPRKTARSSSPVPAIPSPTSRCTVCTAR